MIWLMAALSVHDKTAPDAATADFSAAPPGAWLLEHLDMIIIERPGYELTETPRQYRSVRLGEMAMSSSEVRRRIIEGSEIDSLVPARVIDVLRQTGVLSVS